MKYVFVTEYFESSALALQMKAFEKKDVMAIVRFKEYSKILENLVPKADSIVKFMGAKNLFIFEDASHGKEADELREKGEFVFGGSEESDKWENDRQEGQRIMREAKIETVPSKNFKGNQAFNLASDFVKKNPKRWVIKQNGEHDKSLSTVGKFEDGQDIIDKLDDMKRIWTDLDKVNFDLQEFVDGYECGIEGWFNGKDWITDKTGEPVFLVNFEHKKKSDGDTGRTTVETGTLAYRTRKESSLNRELHKLTGQLRKIKYIGNIDINFIVSKKDKRPYGLEFTTRFGYPSLNLQMEMHRTPWNRLLEGCVKGENGFFEVDPRWAVVIVVQVPPYPFSSAGDEDNAKGQRVYFLDNGKWTGKDEFSLSKLKHIHPYEMRFDRESKHYVVTGDEGYLLTATAQADTVEKANEAALSVITNNIYTSNMDFRKDIGINQRVSETIKFLQQEKLL